jgi:transcriptional regulator with XRE-family HTH domain
MQRLGWLLREIRQRADMSQDEIARLAGASRSQVSRWENGQHEPSYRKIRRLADALRELDPDLDDLSGELVQAAGYDDRSVRASAPAADEDAMAQALLAMFPAGELDAFEARVGTPLDGLSPSRRIIWLAFGLARERRTAELEREVRELRRGA